LFASRFGHDIDQVEILDVLVGMLAIFKRKKWF